MEKTNELAEYLFTGLVDMYCEYETYITEDAHYDGFNFNGDIVARTSIGYGDPECVKHEYLFIYCQDQKELKNGN